MTYAAKELNVLKSINFRALQIYKELYGDLRVLPEFVIQSSNFKRVPAYFNGYKLGRHVMLLREWYKVDQSVFEEEDLKKVNEMGFVWELKERKVELVLMSFKIYHRLHNNCEIPLEFVVPNTNVWPHITWGLKLGEILHSIRSQGTYKIIHDELKELGINFNVQSIKKSKFDRVYDGLVAYKKVNGSLNIPRKYVVPAEDEDFPKHTRGLQLGYELHSILKGRYSEHMEKLRKLGVAGIDTTMEDEKFEKVAEALTTYKNANGNLLVPEDYAVPCADTISGVMLLGKIVKSIRKEGRFAQFRDKLEEIGFVFIDGKNKPIKEVV